MASKQVADINFYRDDNLPQSLLELAKIQGIEVEPGLIAVKTIIASQPKFEFTMIGKRPENLRKFLSQLAADDGGDLEEIAKGLITSE